jgi:hypothetical protein
MHEFDDLNHLAGLGTYFRMNALKPAAPDFEFCDPRGVLIGHSQCKLTCDFRKELLPGISQGFCKYDERPEPFEIFPGVDCPVVRALAPDAISVRARLCMWEDQLRLAVADLDPPQPPVTTGLCAAKAAENAARLATPTPSPRITASYDARVEALRRQWREHRRADHASIRCCAMSKPEPSRRRPEIASRTRPSPTAVSAIE